MHRFCDLDEHEEGQTQATRSVFPWANPGTVTIFPAKGAGNVVAVAGLQKAAVPGLRQIGWHWGKLVRFKASTIASSRMHGPPAGSISGVGDARRERPTGRQPESVHGHGGDQCGRVPGGMVVAE